MASIYNSMNGSHLSPPKKESKEPALSSVKAALVSHNSLTKSNEQRSLPSESCCKTIVLGGAMLLGTAVASYVFRYFNNNASESGLTLSSEQGLKTAHGVIHERAAPTSFPLQDQTVAPGTSLELSHQFFSDAGNNFVQAAITQGPTWLKLAWDPVKFSYNTSYATINTYNGRNIQIIGTTGYLADGGGFKVLDMTQPNNAALVGINENANVDGNVQIIGNTAYLFGTRLGLNVIQIVNITTPSKPILVKTNNLINATSISNSQFLGVTAYSIGTGIYSVPKFSITNMTTGNIIGYRSLADYGVEVQVVSNIAFVANGYIGLTIFSVITSNAINLIGSYDTPGYARGVYVVGNIAFVADGDSGLQIIDVSTPSTPSLLGSFSTAAHATGVQVVGNTAFVSLANGELHLINIATPSAPRLIGSCKTFISPMRTQLIGDTAYVTGAGGLTVLSKLNRLKLIATPNTTTIGTFNVILAGTTTAGTTSTSFNIHVFSSQAAIYQNPISNLQATVNIDFSYIMPNNVFYDPNGYTLTYEAINMPPWLQFNPDSRTFSGQPTPSDTNTYAEKSTVVSIIAKNGKHTSSGQFTISVTGDSYLAKAIKIAGPTLSALGVLYSVYKNQALCLNRYAKWKWRNNYAWVRFGDNFIYEFKTQRTGIRKVQAYVRDTGWFGKLSEKLCCGKQHTELATGLPSWMQYSPELNVLYLARRLKAVDFMGDREMEIRAYGKQGIVRELVKIKLDSTEQALVQIENPQIRLEQIRLLLQSEMELVTIGGDDLTDV